MQTLFSATLLISALGLIISVLLQESDEGGLGAISGNSSESLWGKNRSSSKDATIISAVVFVVSTLVLAAN